VISSKRYTAINNVTYERIIL